MSTLSAARADNFYFPKDFDPSKHKTLHHYNRVKKAEKSGRGEKDGNSFATPKETHKVRYETPFHVRCEKCKKMIAKGVRFNADKKQIGNFHTTKIWEFSFNCRFCPNKIKVHTDPEKCDYNYVAGAYRIFDTENATEGTVIDLQKEKEKKNNPFARLEGKSGDIDSGKNERPRVHQIQQIQEKWKDDFQLNSMLRKKFRDEKKSLSNTGFGTGLGVFASGEILGNKKLKLEELDDFDQRVIDSIGFQKDKVKEDLARKRQDIKNQSIFYGKKEANRSGSISNFNKDVENLRKKLGNLPQGTLNALKLDQRGIAKAQQDERKNFLKLIKK